MILISILCVYICIHRVLRKRPEPGCHGGGEHRRWDGYCLARVIYIQFMSVQYQGLE